MKELVTGGAGFIGSNIVEFLLGQGHEVTVLDNISSGYRTNIELFPAARFVEGDIRNPQHVANAIQGADTVFHLAASVGNKRSIDHPYDDAEINMMGTLNVLIAARDAGIKKVVYSSSAGIFGELKTLPIAEDHPIDPDSPYGSSKLAGEKEVLAFSKIYGMSNVCLRYFNVFGPRQRFDAYGNVIPIFAFKMLRGEPITIFGDGEQTRDFINVKDVVQANYKSALATDTWGAFNLGSGTRVTINHLVELLQEVSGLKATVEHGPLRPGDVRHSLAEISAIRQAVGFEPEVEFVEGLREYMDWAKTEVAR